MRFVALLAATVVASAAGNKYTSSRLAFRSQNPAGVQSCGAIENHTAYMGHDVGGDPSNGTKVASLEECCDLCNANPECLFLTFNAPTCYLKTSDAGRQKTGGRQISASRTAPLPPTPAPPPPPPPYSGSLPNIVFLIVESTDGRTYHPGSDAYIPNIRKLQERGAYFKNFYSNSPVCSASRTSIWSGRHVHRIPHTNQGVKVNGAWNNAEGNPPDFANGWGDALERLGTELNYTSNRVSEATGKGCKYCSFGKTDWTVGAHALWNWLQCWTMYTPLPYNLTDHMSVGGQVAGDGGWSEQPKGGECRTDGAVKQANQTHGEDWHAVRLNAKWLRDTTADGATAAQPFYVYQVTGNLELGTCNLDRSCTPASLRSGPGPSLLTTHPRFTSFLRVPGHEHRPPPVRHHAALVRQDSVQPHGAGVGPAQGHAPVRSAVVHAQGVHPDGGGGRGLL
jgi:hypothetical protein